ncbi:hypothetical protein LJC26_03800, partial [Desulfovibrio sp. OttesenSCG-928-O18]|nr:hypothetical protein [Desulfovibrio sp. OttesenSCG-928-O18]
MKLMHTKLPDFLAKMKMAAATGGEQPKEIAIRGMENLRTVKMQSLRTGRIESAVEEMAGRPGVDAVEMVVIPRVPETMHTVVIKGIAKDGSCATAILETMNILHCTEEAELEGCV